MIGFSDGIDLDIPASQLLGASRGKDSSRQFRVGDRVKHVLWEDVGTITEMRDLGKQGFGCTVQFDYEGEAEFITTYLVHVEPAKADAQTI
jgi:hypothetical protein